MGKDGGRFSADDLAFLSGCAARYIWWKTEDESLSMPSRVIAQVMDIGTLEDMNALAERFGDEALREVLQNAEAGQFRGKSWTYWNYRLGLAGTGQMPPMPERRLPPAVGA